MTRYIGCEVARELLDSFVDGELSVTDQVTVEAHLRWCQACSARVEDLSVIGAAVRMGSPAVRSAALDDRTFAAMQDQVLSRFGAEQDQSLTVRLRAMFEDMHLLWPALGATCAVLICLAGTATVLYATNEEHPDSLAAMITTISGRSGQQNPLRLDNTVVIPRGLDDGPTFDAADDDMVIALATVVSTEGRISDSEFLLSQRAVTRPHGRRTHQQEVDALMQQVRQSRFEPAQALTGRKVAVNMIWLLARTTVKGSARDVDAVNAAAPVAPVRKHEVEKPVVEEDPNGVVFALDGQLPTA
jgi:hypothetical protein